MNTLSLFHLESDRLTLRPPVAADAAEIVRYCSDPRVALPTAAVPHPYRPADATNWIRRVEQVHEEGSALAFAIERKEQPGLIGVISLMFRRGHYSADVGYWLGVPHWRRGYMTEALREILRHGFEDLGLLYISAAHIPENPASGRVMHKAGMKFENIIAGGLRRNGVPHDRVNYGLFADEWRALHH